jgi:hypothetical protein
MQIVRSFYLFLRVHYRKILPLLLGFFLVSMAAWAQEEEEEESGRTRREGDRVGSSIIDDSTRQIYGPKTTLYTYEYLIRENRTRLYLTDTAVWDFHRYAPMQRLQNTYQDLGVVGTAMRPLFYNDPSIIGARSGFTVFDPYFFEGAQFRYYDTKSPFSSFKIVWGGQGRSTTEVLYTRNINPRWNFGFNLQNFSVDKQVARSGRNDRNVMSVYYDVHTSYQSENEKYQLLMNFRRKRHRQIETGGINVDGPNVPISEYFLEDVVNNLNTAESVDLRTNLHLFHQYKVGQFLQAYHSLDRGKQMNTFRADFRPGRDPISFFNVIELDSIQTADRAKFTELNNEFGIKGNTPHFFYSFYYRVRDVNFRYYQLNADTLAFNPKRLENYVGGQIRLSLDSTNMLIGKAEYELSGTYKLSARLASKWGEASYSIAQYEPSLLLQGYRGNHNSWNNNFGFVTTNQIKGRLDLRYKSILIQPGLHYQWVNKFVYLRQVSSVPNTQQVVPVQATSNFQVVAPSGTLQFDVFKRFRVVGSATYSLVTGPSADAFPVPEWFTNAQVSYSNIIFDGNLDFQLGVDFNWLSPYKAQAYMPSIQQFYVQEEFTTPNYASIDVFANFKINRGRVFIKYVNLTQAILGKGVMAAPYYRGQISVLDFGFDWLLFD